MLRVASALILLPIVLGTIWFLPPVATLVLAEIVLLVAYVEYVELAGRLGARFPKVVTLAAVLATGAATGWPGVPLAGLLMAATVALAALAVASGRPGPDVLRDLSAALFAPLYLALPLGALVAVRATMGREALVALLVTTVASDTGQYYGGRLFGRRPLAPAVSPKKTVEGAMAGFVVAPAVMVLVGRAWLPEVAPAVVALLALTVVALGIAGDLFESLLKRSAGVKDTAAIIPGHGGVLDRIDSLLFAAPVYYVFLQALGVGDRR